MKGAGKEQNRTFIAAVAWLLIAVGAFTALESLARWVVWTFFYPGDTRSIAMSLEPLVPLVFGVVGVWCGTGLRKRRSWALRRTVAILWAYVAWIVFALAWNVIEEVSDSSDAIFADRFTIALTISSFVIAIVLAITCAWLARRLSSPEIKAAYLL